MEKEKKACVSFWMMRRRKSFPRKTLNIKNERKNE